VIAAAALQAEPCGLCGPVTFHWSDPEHPSFVRLYGHCRHQEWQLTVTLQPRPTRRFLEDNVEAA